MDKKALIRKTYFLKRKKHYFQISKNFFNPLRKLIEKIPFKKKIKISIYYPSSYEVDILRIFEIDISNKIYWHSSGINHYFADAEITCNAVKNKCLIDQIPIATFRSEDYKGMNIIQGLSLILMIFIWRVL